MLIKYIKNILRPNAFLSSGKYWDERYIDGGNSGAGSYGKFAQYKADIINSFVKYNNVKTVIEFGCGDGNQLKYAKYPDYLGLDVSETAIMMCQEIFHKEKNKQFMLMDHYRNEKAELALSLDVIYHLLEDDIYQSYMQHLCNSAKKYVIIYSSNKDGNYQKESRHVKHRKFTDWIARNCSHLKLIEKIPNKYPYKGDHKVGSFADFYIYEVI